LIIAHCCLIYDYNDNFLDNYFTRCKLLIDVGRADIEALSNANKSAFYYASFRGHDGAVTALLDRGCNLNMRGSGIPNKKISAHEKRLLEPLHVRTPDIILANGISGNTGMAVADKSEAARTTRIPSPRSPLGSPGGSPPGSPPSSPPGSPPPLSKKVRSPADTISLNQTRSPPQRMNILRKFGDILKEEVDPTSLGVTIRGGSYIPSKELTRIQDPSIPHPTRAAVYSASHPNIFQSHTKSFDQAEFDKRKVTDLHILGAPLPEVSLKPVPHTPPLIKALAAANSRTSGSEALSKEQLLPMIEKWVNGEKSDFEPSKQKKQENAFHNKESLALKAKQEQEAANSPFKR
jgi:hypothetical protein